MNAGNAGRHGPVNAGTSEQGRLVNAGAGEPPIFQVVRTAATGEPSPACGLARSGQVYEQQLQGLPAAERGGRRSRRGWRASVLPALAVAIGGCGGADDSLETASLRGDQEFARGNYEDALAEYRLALREDRSIDNVLRAAHAYAVVGRVDEARTLYDEAVGEDSTHVEQAVSDFVARARQAFANRDSYGGASAMETALYFRPGIVVEELVLPMARHYSGSGEHGRALPLYLRALGEQRRDPDIVFETALAHTEIGDCERAMGFFDEFLELAPRREHETRWHVGSCAIQLARELMEQGAIDEALARAEPALADAAGVEMDVPAPQLDPAVEQVIGYLDLVVRLEEPRTMLPDAYFQKAEILARLGECEAAMDAYRRVPEVSVAGSELLARRARERVDQLRFGGGSEPC